MRRALRSDSSPLAVAAYLAEDGADGLIFFDSGTAAGGEDHSIIMCGPSAILTGRGAEFFERLTSEPVENPLEWMLERERARRGREGSGHPDALPFVGGLAGYLGFEFCHQLDDIRAQPDPGRVPDIWVGDFPAAALFDHATQQWIVAGARGESADRLVDAVENAAEPSPVATTSGLVESTVTRDTYIERAARCIDAIYAGELFELNYTERFQATWPGSPFDLYRKLRATSSSHYGGFIDAHDAHILSVSPEQFLSIDGRHVRARPIKGTRRRGRDASEDRRLADELLGSEKDRAENVMIVDLMRNDLTRVCEPGSVRASAICELESYHGVHHLVSTIEGELSPIFSPMTALLSAFPAGSITGAPKLRAIELITELEQTSRGPYTGSMFYASAGGRLDSNVLIRTATLCDGVARYGAGGAVVAQSDPAAEYDEALVKAAPFIEAIEA